MQNHGGELDQEPQHACSRKLLSTLRYSAQAESCPMAIPEILTMIFALLDRKSLLVASRACRAWHQSALPLLWKSLRHPNLTSGFMTQLSRNGCHVVRLDLVLNTDDDSCSVVPTELTRILKSTPRLKSLKLQLSHGATSETISSLLRTIASHLADQLEALTLHIGEIHQDDADEFFRHMTSIKHLELIQCSTSAVLKAIADAQMDHPTGLDYFGTATSRSANVPVAFPQERNFDNAALVYLGKGLKHIKHLSIVNNINITSVGLINFATLATALTHLNLESCTSVEPIGFEAIIQASPCLTVVRLGHTQADDQALVTLTSSPARAAALQSLSVASCQGVTSIGIQAIVMQCENLRMLDFAVTSSVSTSIFDGPAWECSKLERLLMDDIFHGFAMAPQEEAALQNHVGANLVNMYRQLGGLKHLQELSFGATTMDIKLIEFGRHDLESLKKLRVLNIRYHENTMKNREVIWLVTRLPSLEKLELDKNSVEARVMNDLKGINPRLDIKLIERPHDVDDHINQQPAVTGPGGIAVAVPVWNDDSSHDEYQGSDDDDPTWTMGIHDESEDEDDHSSHGGYTLALDDDDDDTFDREPSDAEGHSSYDDHYDDDADDNLDRYHESDIDIDVEDYDDDDDAGSLKYDDDDPDDDPDDAPDDDLDDDLEDYYDEDNDSPFEDNETPFSDESDNHPLDEDSDGLDHAMSEDDDGYDERSDTNDDFAQDNDDDDDGLGGDDSDELGLRDEYDSENDDAPNNGSDSYSDDDGQYSKWQGSHTRFSDTSHSDADQRFGSDDDDGYEDEDPRDRRTWYVSGDSD
ncbi:MAG: hypothetical protein J3Q66DRAFT_332666 [Benniella sp.]|nr:MAG: hypothetical protein J3Q66DRAFT_332666 [Benniella sp.]